MIPTIIADPATDRQGYWAWGLFKRARDKDDEEALGHLLSGPFEELVARLEEYLGHPIDPEQYAAAKELREAAIEYLPIEDSLDVVGHLSRTMADNPSLFHHPDWQEQAAMVRNYRRVYGRYQTAMYEAARLHLFADGPHKIRPGMTVLNGEHRRGKPGDL